MTNSAPHFPTCPLGCDSRCHSEADPDWTYQFHRIPFGEHVSVVVDEYQDIGYDVAKVELITDDLTTECCNTSEFDAVGARRIAFALLSAACRVDNQNADRYGRSGAA